MKLKYTTLLASTLLLPYLTLKAEWTMVDDFQDGDVSDWTFDNNLVGTGDGFAVLTEDFAGGNPENKFLSLVPGTPSDAVETFRPRARKAIPAISGTATIFVRFAQPDAGGILPILNYVWGVAPSAVTELPNFNDFAALMRIEHVNHNFDVYSGDPKPAPETGVLGYQNVASELAVETWYSIWIVVDHVNTKFSVYAQGGPEWPTQTQIYPPNAGEMTLYRNKTFDDLGVFMFMTTAGTVGDIKSADPMYFDDIYIDTTGENLSSPTGDAGPPSDAEFDNISTRGVVGTGPDRLIAGFVVRGVEGTTSGTVMVRAVGPGLTAVGVNSGFLEDPVMDIFQAGVVDPIYSNDNWGDNANAAEIKSVSETIGAFALEDGSKDAVLMLSLPPGVYTAKVGGVGGGTGIAIIEVYAVD